MSPLNHKRNHKTQNRLNNRPLVHRLRRGFALYAVAALACCLATPALAAGDPLAVIDNLNTPEHLHFQHHPGRRPDSAWLGHRAGGPVAAEPRPEPAQSGLFDAGWRHHHHVCP